MSDVTFYIITLENVKRFSGSNFLNQLKIIFFSFSFLTVNTECLSVGLLVGRRHFGNLENVISIFHSVLTFLRLNY